MGLKITEQYYVLTMHTEEKESKIRSGEKGACLLGACICEMIFAGIAHLNEEHRLVINGELPGEYSFLRPLYESVNDAKPKTLKKLINEYMAALTSHKIKELSGCILQDLLTQGLLAEKPALTGAGKYTVKEGTVAELLHPVKEKLTQRQELNPQELILVTLLWESGQKSCFEKEERKEIKAALADKKDNSYVRNIGEMVKAIEEVLVAVQAAAAAAVCISN